MDGWTGGDDVTWFALGATLTVVGLVLSTLAWSRRGPASGLRGIAWSLLPLAAALTGTLRLLADVLEAVVRWTGRLVFSPTVWAGLAVAGSSVLLFAVSAALRRRATPRREAVSPRSSRRDTRALTDRTSAPTTGVADDDLADVEEILRRRGIT